MKQSPLPAVEAEAEVPALGDASRKPAARRGKGKDRSGPGE
jgi:hypothetical protein